MASPVSESDGPASVGGPEYRTMQQIVTDRLRSGILSGRIRPGERLQHDEVARALGVSRMPVREALRVLQSEGLVSLRPHRGAVVTDLRAEDIEEIFEIRALLESRAAEIGVPRLQDEDLGRLRRVLQEMTQADNLETWLGLNQEFHSVIYSASNWPRLCGLVDAQRNAVQPYLRAALTLGSRTATANAEHAEILKAVEVGDGERTGRLLAEHLRSTKKSLMAYIATGRQSGGGQRKPL